jgi:hypothetical protein
MNRLLILLLGLLGPISLPAHHATTVAYDVNNLGTIEGEVTSVFWRNPHVVLTIEREADNGARETWTAESGSPNSLQRIGFSSDIVAVGDRVTLLGALSRQGLPSMAAYIMTLADGTEVPLWPQRAQQIGRGTPPAPFSNTAIAASERAAEGIFRVWSLPTVNFQTDLPLTEFALAARAAWRPLVDDPALRCEAPGMPAMMDGPYPIEFVDQGDSILVRLEEWDATRTIHMQSAQNRAASPPSPYGYSTGRWDGNTLVVRTINVSAPYFDDLGTPLSADAVIVERMTLSADASELTYAATITDPRTFSRPATLTGTFVWTPGEQIKPYNCAIPDAE